MSYKQTTLGFGNYVPDAAAVPLGVPGCGNARLAKLEEELCHETDPERWIDLAIHQWLYPELPTTLVIPPEAEEHCDESAIERAFNDDTLESLLFDSCVDNDTETVRRLLKKGVSPELKNGGGNSALLIACSQGWAPMVETLAAGGAEINEPNEQAGGMTPLLAAARGNHIECVSILLKRKAAVNRGTEQDITPLALACELGFIDVARMLLDAGADVDKEDDIGLTALTTTLLYGDAGSPHPWGEHEHATRLALVQLLSAHGAKRHIKKDVAQAIGYGLVSTAFELAEVRMQEQMHGNGAVSTFLEQTQSWASPLHFMQFHSPARVTELLRGGAMPESGTRNGPKAVDVATQLRADGQAPEGSSAALICAAAAEWAPSNHHLFPSGARGRATELLLIGRRLADKFPRESGAFFDAWRSHVRALQYVTALS